MVVFTCGHCGESVQKPKVEKHYLTKCRNRNPNLSCMDCFKDFLGQDYESHTKCITEEERYSGKGFMAKEKKGEMKQNAWVEMVQTVLEEQKGAPKNVLRIIETISKHNNTPRKKPKFINFVKNVCGQKTNPKDIDQAWDMISVKLSALSNSANNQNKNQKNDVSATNGETDKLDDSLEKNKEDPEGTNKDEEEDQNGVVNHDDVQEDGEKAVDEKKLTKKQKKEEKKRKKYEAALQSAVEPPPEEEVVENTESKKGKKKKNKTDSTSNGDDESQLNAKDKNKKRKRQDTVNGNHDAAENGPEAVEVVVAKEKTVKKKLKTDDDELEDSICLHDQNVAKIEELCVKDKFNWHAVILSVLEKKGNEVPFKRLQKKVLGEYSEATGQDVDDRIADKFIKKLKSAPNVRVDKNRVLLIV